MDSTAVAGLATFRVAPCGYKNERDWASTPAHKGRSNLIIDVMLLVPCSLPSSSESPGTVLPAASLTARLRTPFWKRPIRGDYCGHVSWHHPIRAHLDEALLGVEVFVVVGPHHRVVIDHDAVLLQQEVNIRPEPKILHFTEQFNIFSEYLRLICFC